MPFYIRKSYDEDLEEILAVFDSAKKFMRSYGNIAQWTGMYPGRQDVIRDMRQGNHYVGINNQGKIVLTFSFIVGDDPTYKQIDGHWLNEEKYGTIHRIASNGTERGVLKKVSEYCFNIVSNIRIDTHHSNIPMLKALSETQYTQCGIIICRDGSPRIAFQKQAN